LNDQVLLDLTSLVEQPYRTGIQRVEREVLRHWPDRMQLVPCVIDPSGLIWRLPPDILAILCPAADRPRRSFAEDQSSLAALRRAATPLPGSARRHILNLELFYEPWRAQAYARMCKAGWRVQWLVYDFIPWLSPNLFAAGATQHCMHYLRALREVPEVAFISAQTRDEYHRRVMRQASMAGPVLPLGADGLGLERQAWSRGRRAIVVIGSVERRKNPHLVAEAFRRLWAQGIAAPLIFAGRINQEQESLVHDLVGEARDGLFRIVDHPTDDEMRDLLRGARAVLNASEVEGFGLAPYEALHCGIPVVTPGTLPSLSALPEAGQIRLRDVNAETLADAVRRVMDDDTAERLWRDAVGLELPTWRGFAHDVAAWTETATANQVSSETRHAAAPSRSFA
jgi:glycosyltransferase involved in cell wall biosynthesis